MTVKLLVLKPTADPVNLEPRTTVVQRSSLDFPVIKAGASHTSDGVEVDHVDDTHVNVVDKRAGNSNIKVFSFSRHGAWILEGVEDWSISEKDLVRSSRPGLSVAENYCLQRATAYAGLGGTEQYRLTRELFEAALENYLCAAASGDPQASLDAASLSLSEMAPQLEASKVEVLFKAAATTLADGAAGLSTFYCYGNTTDGGGTCRHPEQAEKELIRAAAMGSVDATYYLGYSFETGGMATTSISRAIACYRLAAEHGNQAAANRLKRLEMKAADVTAASRCY